METKKNTMDADSRVAIREEEEEKGKERKRERERERETVIYPIVRPIPRKD